jgi:hypothetical protein
LTVNKLESDEELFEDDPIEYIRRDLEGSDSDTRRRAATDFVRSLSEQFEGPLTSIFGEYLSHFLQARLPFLADLFFRNIRPTRNKIGKTRTLPFTS